MQTLGPGPRETGWEVFAVGGVSCSMKSEQQRLYLCTCARALRRSIMLMSRWLRDKCDAPQEGPGLEMGPRQLAGIVEAGTGTHGRASSRVLDRALSGQGLPVGLRLLLVVPAL